MMQRSLKYLSLFCCSLLLSIFFGQINGSTLAQKVSQDTISVTAIAFTSDGKNLAAGVKDGRVVVVDPENGREKRTLSGHLDTPVTGVVFNPNGKTVASVGRDSVARVSDIATGEQMNLLQVHENPPRDIATSPDGNIWVTAGEDTKVAIWDAQSGKLQRVLEGHVDFVNSVAVSPDGKTVASGSEDANIILWNIETGKKLKVLLGHTDGVTSVAFSPDGQYLASASEDGTVRLWSVNNSTELETLKGPTKRIRTVAFNRVGTVLVGAGDDSKVFSWNVPSGTPLGSFQAKNKSISGIAFNPTDDNTIATGDEGGEITLWDLPRGQQKRNIVLSPKAKEQQNQQKAGKIQKSKLSAQTAIASPRSKTLIASVPPPPTGPILIVTSSSNPFTTYYTEILRNEGLNYFSVSDISSVSSTTLANYDVVILGDMSLTSQQVTMFTNWVNGGGNLIAMHPDKQLAGLLGLTDTNTTVSNGYLLVNTSTAAGNGIVNQTIQFHGTADRYTLNGATSVATLYTNATTITSNPAVSLHTIGSNGGQAAAFTYDLAKSIVYTRQGNPNWAGQERDGFSPIRSDDLYFGDASNDPQADWVDLNKVAIPQADEQQRLLVNLILTMNLSKKPLPRFWYFPHGKKAVILMTGDDHANGGTGGRFDQFKANSSPGCSVEDWECIRGTSYVYPTPSMPLTNAQAAAYEAEGFEISLHTNTNCSDFTPTSINTFYTEELSEFSTKYPSLAAPSTGRLHCLVWSDWDTLAQVEQNKGIRLNTTYYYWPPSWVLNRPGFFTGSGMPMRLAEQDGTIIDVYEANTQMTDESGQSYPYTVDTLLDRALGSEGYYGVFNVNAHTDTVNSSVSDAVVNSAKTRGVPVVSAKQMLTWLDGRDNSSFGSISWNNSNGSLSFTITKATGATGLQAILPKLVGNIPLISITRDGNPVSYTTETIKGIVYARFAGDTGSYVATYAADTVAPTVTSTSPNNNQTNVNFGTIVTATFNEAIDPVTINTNTFELRNAANALVSATVTYDAATKTARLTPNGSLAVNTNYTATLKGGTTDPRVKDLAANALANNYTWTFTTGSLPCPSDQPCSIWNNAATPTNPSEADSSPVELGVKFRSSLDGYITGIRFYKGNGNTGTHVGTLWSSTGQQLARATFTNETITGWQEVSFATPVMITANTVYLASYHTNVGRYAADANFFANFGVNNTPLYALRNGESGGNGVYAYNANPTFPSNSFSSSNYWVDAVFTTSLPVDTTPPTVTAITPSNNATGVSTSLSVTATFSEAMDATTINTNTFELQGPNATLVAATVSYNAATRTATLTPSSPLATNTTYTTTVKGGGTGVKDLAGNALAQNYTWSFTTSTTSSVSIWSSTATPAIVTTNDPNAVELGVKFRANVNGLITGLRFYKGPQNTGTHVGTLWSSTGQQLATATFTNETASGWQEVNFATPVAITANTVYVASYHTNVGYYSKNENYFVNSGVNNPPLYALRNGESGTNGVYKYGAQGFPTSSYRSTNYWVDVLFSPN
jgi:WD40 repeat protein